MTQTNIIIRFELEGIHNWPAAKEIFPDVGFLSDPHRHMFHFEMKKQVNHDDRDVEIIRFKREVMGFLMKRYGTSTELDALPYRHLDFGSKSCEMLARELCTEFDCNYVSVIEDGENGAEIVLK